MKNSFGVIDIGSNSVRMVIYDVAQNPPVQVYNEKVYCALGRDLTQTGKLNPEGVVAALQGLKAYAAVAKDRGLVRLDVVGTAALRDASDGSAFIERAQSETGLMIRLITGDEEARYAALGVLSLDPHADGIVGDFGGGSLEFARIGSGNITATISKPYGAFRALSMQDGAEKMIGEGLRELIPIYGNTPALYAIGGSWRSLAQAYLIDHGLAGRKLQGCSISRDEILPFCDKVMALSPDDMALLYNIEDQRAALAPISAFVLKQVMTVLSPARMVVSMAGIRDGIVYDFNNL